MTKEIPMTKETEKIVVEAYREIERELKQEKKRCDEFKKLVGILEETTELQRESATFMKQTVIELREEIKLLENKLYTKRKHLKAPKIKISRNGIGNGKLILLPGVKNT